MDYYHTYKEVLLTEAKALERIAGLVHEEDINKVVALFEMLISTGGKVVICGVGKSGLVGQKIAATFTSLGLPSLFLHPTEALHGDLGLVAGIDVVCFISKSGSTEEILRLIPFIKVPKQQRIALLGNTRSSIAQVCGVVFDCSVEKEACVNNQAPTTSSTAALAVGDALAVIYEYLTGLSKEGFAVNHPGGLLGKSLSLKVETLMIPAPDCAAVSEGSVLKDALLEMTNFPLGICAVLKDQRLSGVIVEGDIRRALGQYENPLEICVKNIMTSAPIVISQTELAFKALELMERRERPISVLPVTENGRFIGVIRLHDLLKAGFNSPAN